MTGGWGRPTVAPSRNIITSLGADGLSANLARLKIARQPI